MFVPTKAAAGGKWTEMKATDGYWYYTNGFTAGQTKCGQANACSLEDAIGNLAALNSPVKLGPATIHSVAVGKGRDYEFHGAVDALRIGTTTYDFEARGVVVE